MSRLALLLMCASLVGFRAAPPQSTSGALNAARLAIGGEAKLRAVKSLLLVGTERLLNLADGQMGEGKPFEIRILLPGNYLRLEDDGKTLRLAGYRGDELLNDWRPLQPNVKVSANYGPDQIKTERRIASLLLLGLVADAQAVLPWVTRPGAVPNQVDVLAPDVASLVVDLDPATHVPLRYRYQASVALPQPGGQRDGPPPFTKAEVTATLGERRDVSGISLPFRITKTANGITLQDTRFDKIMVNPPLTAKDFAK